MKQKGILLLAAELTLTCILVGCGPTNREKLRSLEAGMTKGKVLQIMGQPYERATYGNSEWLVYQTDSSEELVSMGPGSGWIEKPDNEWLTPLLLRDGKLVGTDKKYWKNKYKYRVLR
ncbi:MAG: outer membrane protein assembly factor BamE domain-containing protein [Planctomycetota bacterium]|jgi:hypothetical protein